MDGQGMTTRQVSAILQLAIYKVREHHLRAVYLFKMFTDFFEKWPSIFRPGGIVTQEFQDFILVSIKERLTPALAAKKTNKGTWKNTGIRNSQVIKAVTDLKSSHDEWDRDTWNLILEFDRYNNARILPPVLRRATPYPRKRQRQYLNQMVKARNLPEATVQFLLKQPRPKSGAYYFAVFPQGELYKVVATSAGDKRLLNQLTSIGLYVFNTRVEAETYAVTVLRILNEGVSQKRTNADGTKAYEDWAYYRNLIRAAVNFEDLNNITKVLDEADVHMEQLEKSTKLNLKM